MVVQAVKSGLACLTGVANSGYPLVNFGLIQNPKIPIDGKAITALLKYYSKVADEVYGCPKLILVINFDLYPAVLKEAILISLGTLEAEDLISHVYIVHVESKAERKKKRRSLNLSSFNLAKMKKSKGDSSTFCTCILDSHGMSTVDHSVIGGVEELQTVLELEQLGYNRSAEFVFKLNSWIHLRNNIEKLQDNCENCYQNCERLQDDLNTNCDVQVVKKLEFARRAMTDKVLATCRETINLFLCPYVDPVLSEMEGKVVFKHARRTAMNCLQKIITIDRSIRAKLGSIKCSWNDVSGGSKLFASELREDVESDDTDVNLSSISLDSTSLGFGESEVKVSKDIQVVVASFSKLLRLYSCYLKDDVSDDVCLCHHFQTDIKNLCKNIYLIKDFDVRNSARLLMYRCAWIAKNSKECCCSQGRDSTMTSRKTSC